MGTSSCISYNRFTEIWCFYEGYVKNNTVLNLSPKLKRAQNYLLWNGLEIWDVAVSMEYFWTLVTAHQLPPIHAHCTPVLIRIILLRVPSILSMF